jgi:hypothetical protein
MRMMMTTRPTRQDNIKNNFPRQSPVSHDGDNNKEVPYLHTRTLFSGSGFCHPMNENDDDNKKDMQGFFSNAQDETTATIGFCHPMKAEMNGSAASSEDWLQHQRDRWQWRLCRTLLVRTKYLDFT